GGYADPLYVNSQPPLIVLIGGEPQGNGVPGTTDPNRWQPLAFDVALTQNGLEADLVQKYVGVTWLQTRPFALERMDNSRPWIDPGGPARLGTATDTAYKQGALDILRSSSRLNNQAMIDISPGIGGIGNNPLGSDSGTGLPLNPVTGQPYAANPVKEGDFARVLAEFWADGPRSETPPGHWHVLANQVTDHPAFVKKIGGTGPVLDDLEWDVKLYFALSAATHDAACAAWSLKRAYGGVRPITMIRYMGGKGQSSDPAGLSYHPRGLLLEPGVVEVITSTSSATGGRHQGVGNPGEIAVYSWPGEPSDPATQTSPVRWMRAVDWLPYQRKTFNTPAFPGYTSGHSTFSQAAAEVLTAITGSPYFPGGLGTFTAPANTYLVFERGPSSNVTLQWASYFDAADQAGQSRRWGGIHVVEDDFKGRVTGSKSGKQAWALARKYFDGSIMTEVPHLQITLPSASQVKLTWKSIRGLTYGVQACPRLGDAWTDVVTLPPAEGTTATWSGPLISPGKGFYRVTQTAGF
ncbi:MAG: vanadium-dependent haloperoxidase, partial [Armatimonadetes bacterium]|nr:vanadium-dependent haloperoxidase [Akkermansiaceae bacterium]